MAFPTKSIVKLIASGYPIINLISWEEDRVERALLNISQKLYKNPVAFFSWNCAVGLNGPDGQAPDTVDLFNALGVVREYKEGGIFLFKDIESFINDPRIVRQIKEIYKYLRGGKKTVFLLSPSIEAIPRAIEKETTLIDIDLPDMDEAQVTISSLLKSKTSYQHLAESMNEDYMDKCTRALMGLGASEMELALNKAFMSRSVINEEVVDSLLEEKAQMVRKTGSLEYFTSQHSIEDIGGLENLKDWLNVRTLAFSPKAREYGLDKPKGVLVMGVSGCGKSLCAKAISTAWKIPLIRLDLSQVYGGTLGSPEETFRRAIKTVEAVSPCILWIDEIEAGLTRSGEKSGDSPASRIFGFFLTWMQEKKNTVFVAATANQIDLLPPEILRKGRFDEIFFVSLPSEMERRDIFRIHLVNRKQNPENFDIDSLAKNTEGLSGAEIEQAVISALYESYGKNKELDDEEIIIAASSIVPLATTMREDISKLERWAANRAVRASRHGTRESAPSPKIEEEAVQSSEN